MRRKAFHVRILREARSDAAYSFLSRRRDIPRVLAFADRLESLGWLPPTHPRAMELCSQFGVKPHVDSGRLFYELCSVGGRGETDPWITAFFHIDIDSRVIRICSLQLASESAYHRRLAIKHASLRVKNLLKWLDQRDGV